MKSNFKFCALFCLAVFPFVASAEGDVSSISLGSAENASTLVTKAPVSAVANSCAISCVLGKVMQFCKNHPFLTGATVVTLGVAAYVGYDIYKTAQAEKEESEELPLFS